MRATTSDELSHWTLSHAISIPSVLGSFNHQVAQRGYESEIELPSCPFEIQTPSVKDYGKSSAGDVLHFTWFSPIIIDTIIEKYILLSNFPCTLYTIKQTL